MWSVAAFVMTLLCLLATVRADGNKCEKDVRNSLGFEFVKPGGTLLDTFKNLTKVGDCFKTCCGYTSDKGRCNAFSFEATAEGKDCILLKCKPFDKCVFKNIPSSVAGKVIRDDDDDDDDDDHDQAASAAPETTTSKDQTPNGSSNKTHDAESTPDWLGNSNDTVDVGDNWYNTTPPINAEEEAEIEQEEEEWDQIWDAIWEAENEVEQEEEGGGEYAYTTSHQPSASDSQLIAVPSGEEEVADLAHKSETGGDDKHRFGSAYLGSFSDSAIDSPAVVIGASATVLFIVIVLICVGMKLSNRQRNKYKPLREEAFNSNSVSQPLTGGYESYE